MKRARRTNKRANKRKSNISLKLLNPKKSMGASIRKKVRANMSVRDWFSRKRSKNHKSVPIYGYPAETVTDDQVISDLARLRKITNSEIERSDPDLGELLRIVDGDSSEDDFDESFKLNSDDYDPQSYSTTDTSEDESNESVDDDNSDIEQMDISSNDGSEHDDLAATQDLSSLEVPEPVKPFKYEPGKPGKSILKKSSTISSGAKRRIRFADDDHHQQEEPSKNEPATSTADHPIISQFRALVNRTSISNLAVILNEFRDLFSSDRQKHSFHAYAKALWMCILGQLNCQPDNINNETLRSVSANFAIFVAGLHRTVDGRIGEYIAHQLSRLLVEESNNVKTRVNAAMLGALCATCVISYEVLLGYMRWILENGEDSKEYTLDALLYLLQFHRADLNLDDQQCLLDFGRKFAESPSKPSDDRQHDRFWFCWNEVLRLCSLANDESSDWIDTRKSLYKITKIRARATCVQLDFQSLCRPDSRFCLEESSFETTDAPARDHRLVAIELQLRTPLRESIIRSVLAANDYIEACDNINTMRLRDAELKQVVVVLVKMALSERPFNEFYPLVLNRLARQGKSDCFNRQLRLHIRKHVFDRMSVTNNLSILIARLIEADSVDLRVLKAFNWSKNQSLGRMEFVRNIVRAVVSRKPEKWFATEFSQRMERTLGKEMELMKRLRDFLNKGMLQFERVASDLSERDINKIRTIVQELDRIMRSHLVE